MILVINNGCLPNIVNGIITIIIPTSIVKNTGKLCLITLISLSKSNFGNNRLNNNPITDEKTAKVNGNRYIKINSINDKRK